MLVCVSHSSGFTSLTSKFCFRISKKNVTPMFEVTLKLHLLWCKTFMPVRKKDLKPRHPCLTIAFPRRLIMSTCICSFRFNTTPVRLISRDSPCTICPDQTPAALLLFAFHLTPCWSKANFPARTRPRAAALCLTCTTRPPLLLVFLCGIEKNWIQFEGIKIPLIPCSTLFLVIAISRCGCRLKGRAWQRYRV